MEGVVPQVVTKVDRRKFESTQSTFQPYPHSQHFNDMSVVTPCAPRLDTAGPSSRMQVDLEGFDVTAAYRRALDNEQVSLGPSDFACEVLSLPCPLVAWCGVTGAWTHEARADVRFHTLSLPSLL